MWTGSARPPPPRCPGLVHRACAMFILSPGPWLAPNYLRLFIHQGHKRESKRERVCVSAVYFRSALCWISTPSSWPLAVSPVASPADPGGRMHDEGSMFHLQAHTHPSENKTGWAPKTSTYLLNNWVFIFEEHLCGTNSYHRLIV